MPASKDYLFTWKPDKWPYEKLKALVDDFEAGRSVVEPWRCQSHRKVRQGDRGYLFKQGGPDRGIFGVATVNGVAFENAEAEEGEGRWLVPLRLDLLVDPTQRFIVTEGQLRTFGANDTQLDTQSSGIGFDSDVARRIDSFLTINLPNTGAPSQGVGLPLDKRERLLEVYERDQTLTVQLKRLYEGYCQICGSAPFGGLFGNLSEAHHIQWLCRGGPDTMENMVLVCPNHHAAIHAADPIWDGERLEFKFPGKCIPIRLDRHLKKS